MALIDKFDPELIVLDLSYDQHIFGGKVKEKDLNTRRRKIKFTYNDQLIDLTGISCRAFILKPDNTVSYITCPIINNEYALLDFTTNSRAVGGIIKVELGVSLADQEISSFVMEFEVVNSLRDDAAIQSSNEFGALQDIINQVGGLGDVQNRLTELESTTGQLKTDNAQLTNTVNNLSQTVTTEITNITKITNNLTAENTELTKKVSDLTTRVAALEGGGTIVNNSLSIGVLPDWYKPPTIKGTELGKDGVPSSYNYNDNLNWVLEPLRTKNPTYITRTNLGKDQSNTYNIYKYEFTPTTYDKTFFISCCLHGNEYTSFYGLCRFLELLCSDDLTDPNLLYLRNQVKLVIVPISNPWGFVNSKRQNSRGVDLNRNFDYKWNSFTTSAGAGQTYYKGTAPFSEKESQILRDLMLDLAGDPRFRMAIDWHTLITIEAEKVFYYPKYRDNLTKEFSKMLQMFDPDTGEDRVIMASSDLPTQSCWAAYVLDIETCNPEWNNAAYGGNRNSFLMTRYVDFFANTIITAAKHCKARRYKVIEPYTQHYYFTANSSKTSEDGNRYSADGWRMLNSSSSTYSTMSCSHIKNTVDAQYLVKASGWIKVKCKANSTMHLFPLLCQNYSTGQNYTSVRDQMRGEITLELKAGNEYLLPFNSSIMAFPSCYNDNSSQRADVVDFRIMGYADTTNAVYVNGFNLTLDFIPTNEGIGSRAYKVTESKITEIYPNTLE